jgi:DNA-binding MarR family transcriptional regulator
MDENGGLTEFATDIRLFATDLVRRCDAILTNVASQQVQPDRLLPNVQDRPTLSQIATLIYKARRARAAISPEKDLFQDPAWDILLDLYIAHCEDKTISVTSASMAAGVPLTTALRWVWHLEQLQMVERQIDRRDRRRSFVSLTKSGLHTIEEALTDYRSRVSFLFQQSNQG